MKRGQISAEYMIVVSFVAFIVIVMLGIAILYSTNIQETIKGNQIENFANKIISSSENVFYSGEPSRITITAYLPSGVDSINVLSSDLVFNITTKSGNSVRAFESQVPLNGTLSSSEGVKRIQLVAESDGVRIIEG